LFLATGDNLQNDQLPAVAIYDVSTDHPVLTRYDRPTQPFFAGAARRGNQLFWCTPPGAHDATVRCAEYDAQAAARRDYVLSVPAAVTFASMAGMIRIDELLYLDLTFDRPDADSHLVTFDVSGAAPVQLDVTDLPHAPWFSGFATTPSPVPLVHGSSLFVGASVLDISQGVPVLQSVLSSPRIVEVSGTQAIGLGREGFEMRAFDLTDPKNPVLLSALAMDRYGYFGLEAARLAGEVLLVPSGRAGLAIDRMVDPGGFLERQMTGDPGSAVFDQTIADGILFTPEAFGDGGELLISDVTKQPATSLARVDLGREQPDAVFHDGNDLVVGTDRALWFFDVTAPAAPRLLTRIAVPAAAMAKVGTWLFAATVRPDGSPALAPVDVSTFAAPVVSDLVVLPGLPVKMAAAGPLLYAAADSDGLLVIDVSSPTAPRVLAQWKPVPFVEDVAVEQTTAFIAGAERGLLIADVSTPGAPVVVSEMPLPRISPGASNRAISLALRRGLVYVGSQGDSGRVFAVDPSNAKHPRVVARSRGAGLLSDSFVASFSFFGDEVFYAGWNDDGFGTTEPGVQANDSQPRNVVLLYPAELESTLASGPQLAAADPARPSPLHPKLQSASRWATQ
ncbi:MAG: LVIVD repeat-containing protein, partial [Myxococcales bacterium]